MFDTGVVPKSAYIITGDNSLILNKAFAGLQYPDKLDSYVIFMSSCQETMFKQDGNDQAQTKPTFPHPLCYR